jgi:hypothetical protein
MTSRLEAWRQPDRATVTGAAVSVGALLLYARTLMPDVGFWDTAEYQAIGPVLGIAHPTGFPAYTMLAWLASVVLQPFGNEAVRANLLAALLVAGASGLLAATVVSLTRRMVVGAATGTAFAVSATVWAVGLRADAHALHIFLAAVLLALLIGWARRHQQAAPADRLLVAAAVVYGIALGNHALTLLLAPGIAFFVLWIDPWLLVRRPRFVGLCALALVATTVLLYLYLPLRAAMNPPFDYAHPVTWESFRYLVFAEQFRGSFQSFPEPLDALRSVALQTWTDLGPLAILALVGLAVLMRRQPALAMLLVAWFAFGWIFALGYVNADIGRYYLVPTLSAALAGGIGGAAAWDWLAARAPARAGRWQRAAAVALAAVLLAGPALAAVPRTFAAVDQSTYTYPRRWLEAVLPALEPDAVVVSWWGYSTTLWYAQFVEHRRPDVWVVDDRTRIDQQLGSAQDVVDAWLGQRPVYLIRLDRDMEPFVQRYRLTRMPEAPAWGPIYRVDALRQASWALSPTIGP